ncbi:DNA breaking-rejoining enzyme [Pisolithus tinctorius]|nr:DNA breaking-rejoining enzyme [Pisolithus tinctorius]
MRIPCLSCLLSPPQTDENDVDSGRCDSIMLKGTSKPPSEERGTYGHVQKMRAAMTYAFGRLHGLGDMPWHQSEVPGNSTMLGNPSMSVQVSSYMCALQRRKVQAGEVAISARAISSEILSQLYHFNHLPDNWTIRPYQPGTRRPRDPNHCGQDDRLADWGGARARCLLQAAYTIAFICLLRFDEVLKIQVHDINFMYDATGTTTGMSITLPFRKTHQTGDIKPYFLWAFHQSEAHLCAVRAISEWIIASNITSGYLFHKIASGDRVAEANVPMSSEQFLEMFQNNLLDLNIDPAAYGTHSFRRGGCQYLHIERRWPLRKICEWGGWSQEFTNLTIVKYLISVNDDAMEAREDFFNPNHRPALKCPHCGRSCACG